MPPDFVFVLPVWTIEQSLQHIRRKGREAETIGVIYVTDARWMLLNARDLERFVLATPSAIIESIMDHSFVAMASEEDREEAVKNAKIRSPCTPDYRHQWRAPRYYYNERGL